MLKTLQLLPPLLVAGFLQIQLPEGTVPTERIKWPVDGYDADCGEKNTVHVDCFLYDDHALEAMVKEGMLQKRYCVECGSKNIKDLKFISHSLAHCQLEFIFTQLVPLRSQISGFQVLDIGSRLGAVIFAASLYGSGTTSVTGIERNQELVKLQEDVIRDFSLQNIEVVCADVRNRADLVRCADLIVMNNVFSFFMELDEQADCFKFIRENAKKGCLIVHNPDIKIVLNHLKLPFTVDEWLEKIPIDDECDMFANGDKDVLTDCAMLSLYKVR